MKRLALLLLLATPLLAATSRNDDSCDIGLFPAATLLLPYFEVDVRSEQGLGETTIFTVTNTAPAPQAARVTLWTDYAYPIVSFNIYLTGYDVQSINLYDVIARGVVEKTGSEVSPKGPTASADNSKLNEASCADLAGPLPPAFVERMKSAFTMGKAVEAGESEACNTAGGVHMNAVGYATIDVVGACTGTSPLEATYFTHELRFDNVLMGDYIQVNGREDFAQANPMVHIRAIPEGGDLSTRKKTNLPRTFYSRLQSSANVTADGRQPLPSTFGARWIEGGSTGFETFFKLWRETRATSKTACAGYSASASMPFEAVRFDEEENPETFSPEVVTIPIPGNLEPRALPSSLIASTSVFLPPNATGTAGGWIYFNLHDDTGGAATQNWLIVSMRADKRFSVDLDAVSLSNGCTPPSVGIEELTSSQ